METLELFTQTYGNKMASASYVSGDSTYDIYFGNKDVDEEYHKLSLDVTKGEQTTNISYCLEGCGKSAPELDGNSYKFNMSEGLDCEYLTFKSCIKERITVREKAVLPDQIRSFLTIPENVTAKAEHFGLVITDNATTVPLLWIKRAYIIDANGEEYHVNQSYADGIYTLDLTDIKANDKVAYPIVIDPTISTDCSNIPNYVPQKDGMCIDSDGTMWAVWKAADAAIRWGYSTDEGANWTDSGDLFTGQTYSNPRITIDLNDNMFCAYMYGTTLYLKKYTKATTSWGSEETVSAGITGWTYGWSLDSDSSGNVRVIYHATNVMYRQRNADGSWEAAAQMNTVTGVGAGCAIACGSDDTWHAVYVGTNSGSIKVQYKYDSGAGWQAEEQVASETSVDLKKPTICVKSTGVVVVSFDKDTVVYLCYRSAPPAAADWSAKDTVDTGAVECYGSSLSVDQDDVIYCAYMYKAIAKSNIRFAYGQAGSWTYVDVTNSIVNDNYCPVLVWHGQPAINVPLTGAYISYYNGTTTSLDGYATVAPASPFDIGIPSSTGVIMDVNTTIDAFLPLNLLDGNIVSRGGISHDIRSEWRKEFHTVKEQELPFKLYDGNIVTRGITRHSDIKSEWRKEFNRLTPQELPDYVLGGYVINRGSQQSDLRITTTTLPAGKTGHAYSQSIAATGGIPPYLFYLDATIDTVSVGNQPWILGMTADGAYLYCPNQADNTVSVIRTSDFTNIATISHTWTQPVAVFSNVTSDYVYVGCDNTGGDNNIYKVRVSDNTIVATFSPGAGAHGMAFTSDGLYAYISNEFDNNIDKIQLSDNSVVATIPMSDSPSLMILNSANTYLYISCSGGNCVDVIRTSDNTQVADITVGTNPVGLCLTVDESYLYVANNGSGLGGSISIVSTVTNTVIDTITISVPGFQPLLLSKTNDGKYMFLSCPGSGVYVIRTSDRSLVCAIYEYFAFGNTISLTNDYLYTSLAFSAKVSRLDLTALLTNLPPDNLDLPIFELGLSVTLSGNPITVGTYPFTVRVYDQTGNTDVQAYSLAMTAGERPPFGTTVIPSDFICTAQDFPSYLYDGKTATYSGWVVGDDRISVGFMPNDEGGYF